MEKRVLFKRVRFSDEGEEGRSRMLSSWSKESLGENKNSKARRRASRLSIIVSDKQDSNMVSKIFQLYLNLFFVSI